MDYIRGENRDQAILFPETINDYISEDNEARFLDAFIGQLDLEELGFERAKPNKTGRPSYEPGDLLRLYVYGYLNRIRSSRRLEKSCVCNIEVMWLLGKLHPDFKTIADFRKNNLEPIKQVFKEFVLFCKDLDLYGCEMTAIDGSKFKAVNNKSKNFTEAKLEKRIHEIEEKIDRYLKRLETEDEKEKGIKLLSKEELQKKIKILKERKHKYEGLSNQLKESEDTQVSLTDPESRLMKVKQGHEVSYNAQTSVDDKHHLIAENDVTNECTDQHQLSDIAIKSKEILEVDQLNVISDKGYYEGDQVKTCLENNVTPYVPKPGPKKYGDKTQKVFHKQEFRYDSKEDCYICPNEKKLHHLRNKMEHGKDNKVYETSECSSCPLREKCCSGKSNRHINRWVNEEIMEEMAQRIKDNPELYAKRKCLVEHPFGTIKFWWGHHHFLMKGLKKVRTEFSMSCLAYNMRRVINIMGVENLLLEFSKE